MDRQADRLESIKAAGFSIVVAGIVSSIVVGINIWLSRTTTVVSLSPSTPSELAHLGLTTYGLGSIGLLVSAALFGHHISLRCPKQEELPPRLGGGGGIRTRSGRRSARDGLESSVTPGSSTVSGGRGLFGVCRCGRRFGLVHATGLDTATKLGSLVEMGHSEAGLQGRAL